MDFWFCEKCGKRVTTEHLTRGGVREEDGSVLCADCAPPPIPAGPPASASSAQRLSVHAIGTKDSRSRVHAANVLTGVAMTRRSAVRARQKKSGAAVAFIAVGVALLGGAAVLLRSPSKATASTSVETKDLAQSAALPPAPVPAVSAAAIAVEPPASPAPAAPIPSDAVPADPFHAQEIATVHVEIPKPAAVAKSAKTLTTTPKTPAAKPAVDQVALQAGMNRGLELLKHQDAPGAIEIFDKLIEQTDRVSSLFQNRADARRVMGDFEGCFDDADRAAKLDPHSAGAWALRAIAAYGLNRTADCRASLSKASAATGVSAEELEKSIGPEMQRAQTIVAGREFEQKPPTSAREFVARGNFRLCTGNLDGGIDDLEEALKREPTLKADPAAGVLPNLAAASRSSKKFKDALKYYKEWADANPEEPDALNAYAWELLTSGDPALIDPAAALPFAEHAVELTHNKNPAILDTLALAYFKNKRVDSAVEREKLAMTLLPKSALPTEREEYAKRLTEFQTAASAGKSTP